MVFDIVLSEILKLIQVISIIICSRNHSELQKVLLNVETTIGVEFEPVVIDNSNGQYTIFEAYNLGINLSKGDLLCFMHEDIAFETQDWGKRVVKIFGANSNLGLLGVAGASYKPSVPSGWSFPEACTDTMYMNIVQHRKGGEPSSTVYNNPRNEVLSKVASVDGVWFCTTREVVKNIKFDDSTFNNFHCYDIDFSLSVLQKYDVAVTFDVLIHHFSGEASTIVGLPKPLSSIKNGIVFCPLIWTTSPLKPRKKRNSRPFTAFCPG